MVDKFLIVTEAALAHFNYLIAKEKSEIKQNLRIAVLNPQTPAADVGITLCPLGKELPTDLALEFQGFTFFVEQNSKVALTDAKIDFEENKFGGQITIKGANIKGSLADKLPEPPEDASLFDKINYMINAEISPSFAGHGGAVKLVEVTTDGKVRVQFIGGCHGCSSASFTLKSGIEANLRNKFPEITAVEDVTDHTTGENPYYS